MTSKQQAEIIDDILDSLWIDTSANGVTLMRKPEVKKALLALLVDTDRSSRIDELQHIDDPLNVKLYHYGLISLQNRLADLNSSKESNE